MNRTLIAQLTFAGAMVGFLIGPDSLDEFIGILPQSSVVVNVIGGALIGALLGVVASFSSKQVDE